MAQLPAGETNPLSARSRSSQTKRTVRIGVGLLPYISIASVWRRRRSVLMNLAASRHWLCFDTSSCRILPLADLANAIPRSSYLFGASWPDVRRTLLVAVEQDSDSWAVMIPTAEIIPFYYAPSTRLAQALFWGEYSEMFNAERSGIFEGGAVRVHLRRWLEDQDAWTLARYLSSPVMQREAARLYQSLQLDQLNCTSLIAEPDHALLCGFPFEGPTTIQGIAVRLPGATPDSPPRWPAEHRVARNTRLRGSRPDRPGRHRRIRYSAVSKRRALEPSPRPTCLLRPIHRCVEPSSQRAN
jgi:hypothetical protein